MRGAWTKRWASFVAVVFSVSQAQPLAYAQTLLRSPAARADVNTTWQLRADLLRPRLDELKRAARQAVKELANEQHSVTHRLKVDQVSEDAVQRFQALLRERLDPAAEVRSVDAGLVVAATAAQHPARTINQIEDLAAEALTTKEALARFVSADVFDAVNPETGTYVHKERFATVGDLLRRLEPFTERYVDARGATRLRVREDQAEFVKERVKVKEALRPVFADLAYDAVLHDDQTVREAAQWAIRELAPSYGVYSASIRDYYKAMGRREVTQRTIPAMNIRVGGLVTARAALRAAHKQGVGAMVFELAASETGYTGRRYAAYAAELLAAAVLERHDAPVFLKMDHTQLNAKNHRADPAKEIGRIKGLIVEGLRAGFRNIDIDASTIEGTPKFLTEAGVPDAAERERQQFELDLEQQKDNIAVSAALIEFARTNAKEIHGDDNIGLGVEVGEVGKETNTTLSQVRAFLTGLKAELAKRGVAGPDAFSIQTGAAHGGRFDDQGKLIRDVPVAFPLLQQVSDLIRSEEFGDMAGSVQHGASTLAPELFNNFPAHDTAEVHLATEFQNLILGHEALPEALKTLLASVGEELFQKDWEAAGKPENPQKQASIRKDAIKKFPGLPGRTQLFWNLPHDAEQAVSTTLEAKFADIFTRLRAADTRALIARHTEAFVDAPRSPPLALAQALAEAELRNRLQEKFGVVPLSHEVDRDFTTQFLAGRLPGDGFSPLEDAGYSQLSTQMMAIKTVQAGYRGQAEGLDKKADKDRIDQIKADADLVAQRVDDDVAALSHRRETLLNYETKGEIAGGHEAGMVVGDPQGRPTWSVDDPIEGTTVFVFGDPGASSIKAVGPGAKLFGSFPDEARALMVVARVNPALEAAVLTLHQVASIEEFLNPSLGIETLISRIAALNGEADLSRVHVTTLTADTGDVAELKAISERTGLQYEVISEGTVQPAVAATLGVKGGPLRIFLRRSGMTEAVWNTLIASAYTGDGAYAGFQVVSPNVKKGMALKDDWSDPEAAKVKTKLIGYRAAYGDINEVLAGKIFSSRQVTEPIAGSFTFASDGRTDQRLPFDVPGVQPEGAVSHVNTLVFASNPQEPGQGYLQLVRSSYGPAAAPAAPAVDPKVLLRDLGRLKTSATYAGQDEIAGQAAQLISRLSTEPTDPNAITLATALLKQQGKLLGGGATTDREDIAGNVKRAVAAALGLSLEAVTGDLEVASHLGAIGSNLVEGEFGIFIPLVDLEAFYHGLREQRTVDQIIAYVEKFGSDSQTAPKQTESTTDLGKIGQDIQWIRDQEQKQAAAAALERETQQAADALARVPAEHRDAVASFSDALLERRVNILSERAEKAPVLRGLLAQVYLGELTGEQAAERAAVLLGIPISLMQEDMAKAPDEASFIQPVPATSELQREAEELEAQWKKEEALYGIKRDYTWEDFVQFYPADLPPEQRPKSMAEAVLRLRGALDIETYATARENAEQFREIVYGKDPEEFIFGLGVYTSQQVAQVLQARQQLKRMGKTKAILGTYGSGWNDAADNNDDEEIYSDLSLYSSPATQVRTVRRVNNAAQFTARQAALQGQPGTRKDWRPLHVVDFEALGSERHAFVKTRAVIKAGAGIGHDENQVPEDKVCGHLKGACNTTTTKMIAGLKGQRLAGDVMGVPFVIIGRTDALHAQFLLRDDPRDRSFILGVTNDREEMTYDQAVANGFAGEWKEVEITPGRFVTELKAGERGTWAPLRNRDQLYLVRPGIERAIATALEFAPYSDLLWFEDHAISMEHAKQFAEAIHAKYPGKPLAFNLSGNLPWDKHLGTEELETFQKELAKLGYKYQFITTFGFHGITYSTYELALDVGLRGMVAYAEHQAKEQAAREHGYTAFDGNRETGTGYWDSIRLMAGTPSPDALALRGSTAGQFYTATPAGRKDPTGGGLSSQQFLKVLEQARAGNESALRRLAVYEKDNHRLFWNQVEGFGIDRVEAEALLEKGRALAPETTPPAAVSLEERRALLRQRLTQQDGAPEISQNTQRFEQVAQERIGLPELGEARFADGRLVNTEEWEQHPTDPTRIRQKAHHNITAIWNSEQGVYDLPGVGGGAPGEVSEAYAIVTIVNQLSIQFPKQIQQTPLRQLYAETLLWLTRQELQNPQAAKPETLASLILEGLEVLHEWGRVWRQASTLHQGPNPLLQKLGVSEKQADAFIAQARAVLDAVQAKTDQLLARYPGGKDALPAGAIWTVRQARGFLHEVLDHQQGIVLDVSWEDGRRVANPRQFLDGEALPDLGVVNADYDSDARRFTLVLARPKVGPHGGATTAKEDFLGDGKKVIAGVLKVKPEDVNATDSLRELILRTTGSGDASVSSEEWVAWQSRNIARALAAESGIPADQLGTFYGLLGDVMPSATVKQVLERTWSFINQTKAPQVGPRGDAPVGKAITLRLPGIGVGDIPRGSDAHRAMLEQIASASKRSLDESHPGWLQRMGDLLYRHGRPPFMVGDVRAAQQAELLSALGRVLSNGEGAAGIAKLGLTVSAQMPEYAGKPIKNIEIVLVDLGTQTHFGDLFEGGAYELSEYEESSATLKIYMTEQYVKTYFPQTGTSAVTETVLHPIFESIFGLTHQEAILSLWWYNAPSSEENGKVRGREILSNVHRAVLEEIGQLAEQGDPRAMQYLLSLALTVPQALPDDSLTVLNDKPLERPPKWIQALQDSYVDTAQRIAQFVQHWVKIIDIDGRRYTYVAGHFVSYEEVPEKVQQGAEARFVAEQIEGSLERLKPLIDVFRSEEFGGVTALVPTVVRSSTDQPMPLVPYRGEKRLLVPPNNIVVGRSPKATGTVIGVNVTPGPTFVHLTLLVPKKVEGYRVVGALRAAGIQVQATEASSMVQDVNATAVVDADTLVVKEVDGLGSLIDLKVFYDSGESGVVRGSLMEPSKFADGLHLKRPIRVAINGAGGRTGLTILRQLLLHHRPDQIQVVAVNARSAEYLKYALQHDTEHGEFSLPIELGKDETGDWLEIQGQRIWVYSQRILKGLPWVRHEVDIAVDATGEFVSKEALAGHLEAGAKRVILTNPSDAKKADEHKADFSLLLGVNEDQLPADAEVIDCASCTTNSYAPPMSIAKQGPYRVLAGVLGTTHAVTGTQRLTDGFDRRRERGRAAPRNMVLTETGADRATVPILPDLAGKLSGTALRVPTGTGSISVVTNIVEVPERMPLTAEGVNEHFRKLAATDQLQGILAVEAGLVGSQQIVGRSESSILLEEGTQVTPLGGNRYLVRQLFWYDNEWGYSARVVDAVYVVGAKLIEAEAAAALLTLEEITARAKRAIAEALDMKPEEVTGDVGGRLLESRSLQALALAEEFNIPPEKRDAFARGLLRQHNFEEQIVPYLGSTLAALRAGGLRGGAPVTKAAEDDAGIEARLEALVRGGRFRYASIGRETIRVLSVGVAWPEEIVGLSERGSVLSIARARFSRLSNGEYEMTGRLEGPTPPRWVDANLVAILAMHSPAPSKKAPRGGVELSLQERRDLLMQAFLRLEEAPREMIEVIDERIAQQHDRLMMDTMNWFASQPIPPVGERNALAQETQRAGEFERQWTEVVGEVTAAIERSDIPEELQGRVESVLSRLRGALGAIVDYAEALEAAFLSSRAQPGAVAPVADERLIAQATLARDPALSGLFENTLATPEQAEAMVDMDHPRVVIVHEAALKERGVPLAIALQELERDLQLVLQEALRTAGIQGLEDWKGSLQFLRVDEADGVEGLLRSLPGRLEHLGVPGAQVALVVGPEDWARDMKLALEQRSRQQVAAFALRPGAASDHAVLDWNVIMAAAEAAVAGDQFSERVRAKFDLVSDGTGVFTIPELAISPAAEAVIRDQEAVLSQA
ncbi:MAG: class II fructose-bisphosphate aldolase [Candidatus Omnitrophica bacterium]|nr:class II fructose-bisphosphate aldolase [Candidatus Omnitrophota bacterium]